MKHQIYDEVLYFFFSMLEIHLSPACVLSMALNSTRVADTPGSKLISNGVVTPDTLASFKKITFEIDFSLQVGWLMGTLEGELSPRTPNKDTSLLKNTMPRLFVDENLTVDPNGAAKLLAFYKCSTIVHHFVNLVSKSPELTRLVIALHASVFADFDIDSDRDMDMSRDGLMTAVADECATELLLDSGLLAPLEKLSNVQCFQFEFETQDRNGELYKPTAKHLGLLMDLKQMIERNYSVRNG